MCLKHLLLLTLVISTSFQLDRMDQQEEEDEDAELYEDLTFPPENITKKSILENHEKIDTTERKFRGAALAYVTPWNNKGYDLAKETAHKLTHISPVWLQLKPDRNGWKCHIEGIQDVDRDWMAALREKNEHLKIVPRILFDGWNPDDLVEMINHEIWGLACLRDVVLYLERSQFDGAVVELWSAVMHMTRGKAGDGLVEFFAQWGEAFHKREKPLEIIVPVGPPVGPNKKLTGMFLPSYINSLTPQVDYIQLMTYDYPADLAHPVAPYDWVEASIDMLLKGRSSLADRLMIGLNHYGYSYTSTMNVLPKVEAVKFDQYLDLLKKGYRLLWDKTHKEHMIDSGNVRTFYPSLTSLELRIRLAEDRGVGIAIWEYGQGLNYFTQLL